MTDMIARAAEALLAALKRPFGDFSRAEMERPWNVTAARMVLSAALNPEDEALVETAAQAMLGFAYPGSVLATTTMSNREYFTARARETITALKAYTTQGE